MVQTIQEWIRNLPSGGENETPLASLSASLRDHLRRQDFRSDDLPDGDIHIEMSLDLRSGRAMARQSVLNPLSGPVAGLEHRLRTTVLSFFSERANAVRQKIVGLIATNDHETAAREAIVANTDGVFDAPKLPSNLLTALNDVVTTALSEDVRIPFLLARAKVAEDQDDLPGAARDADAILKAAVSTLTAHERRSLIALSALGDASRGATATAYARLNKLLHEEAAPAVFRAWICRNMALALGPRDPAGSDLARMSYDAFVEDGQLLEGLRSVALYVRQRASSDPSSALSLLDDAEALVAGGSSDLSAIDLRAGVFALKAEVELENGQFALALGHAQEAADRWRGTVGAEDELLRALGLARAASSALDDEQKTAHFTANIAQLLDDTPQRAELVLRERALALVDHFDTAEASAIKADAERKGQPGVQALVMTSEVMFDAITEPSDRLRHLEQARALLSGPEADDDALVVDAAIARELATQQNYDAALRAYEEVLRRAPNDQDARQSVASLLVKLQKWPDAMRFFQAQLDRFGPLPGILFGLGRAQFERAMYSDAATNLQRVLGLVKAGNVREQAQHFLERALERGGKLAPPSPPAPPPFVDRKEWRSVLEDFAAFIGQSKRQSFWRGGKPKTRWRELPERFAQDLFVTFVKGKLGGRVELFEELPNVGAGRLDVLVLLSGGMRSIVELKMLGGGSYSETYAFSGEEQIGHYMANKNTHLGYLLIFDARIDAWASGVQQITHITEGVVETLFVDVRREVRRARSRR